MHWSIRLSASMHHPLGVAALGDHLGRGVRADPARAGLPVHQAQADPQHLPDPPLGEPDAGVVRHRQRSPAAPATMPDRRPAAGRRRRRPGRPTARAAPSRPGRAATMHEEQRDRGQAVPRVVGGQPEDLPHRAGAAAVGGSGGGSAFAGTRDRDGVAPPTGADASASGSRRPSRPATATPPPEPPSPAAAGRRRGCAAGGQQLGEALATSRSGPASTTSPSASTTTSSQRRTEESRCAMTMPIRSAQQPFGGPLHPRLGDRVHPGGGLVEDHHVRVADQDPGERHQLLLPGGQHVAALAEPGVHAVRQLGRPRRPRPSSSQRPAGRGRAAPGRTGRCSRRACRPGSRCAAARRHPPAQRLDVEVEQVGAAEEHRAAAARRPPG